MRDGNVELPQGCRLEENSQERGRGTDDVEAGVQCMEGDGIRETGRVYEITGVFQAL